LWRGFDHPGPPPEEEIEGRKYAQEAPNFRHDLTIVAVAPNGDYVSFCGIWYVPENKLTYVEPVATDPDYRRMGLGTAVVLEGIRRTVPLGSEVAWVGSDQAFYEAIGFTQSYQADAWIKYR
jgi:predicted N-acetyltransferase YhbS